MNVLDHILCGHRHDSKVEDKSRFSREFDTQNRLRRLGNEVYGKGKRIWTGKVWKISHSVDDVIGITKTGKPSKTVEMITDAAGRIKTMYPL